MSALADALGHKAVRALSAVVGGRTLRIPGLANDPASRKARDRLIGMVGVDLATDLITAFAKTRVYVPKATLTRFNSRRAGMPIPRLIALRERMSAQAVALEMGCTERAVFDRLREFRTASGPVDREAARFGLTVAEFRRFQRRLSPVTVQAMPTTPSRRMIRP